MDIFSKDEHGLAVDFATLCVVCTTNAGDGLQRGEPSGELGPSRGSFFISDYEAPQQGYTNCFSFFQKRRGVSIDTNDDRHYLYYFRIRSQINERGEVTNALYGKIYGQLNGNFTYYLNPTPNDRNVEFDTRSNLFTNLRSFEQVRRP